MSNSIAIVANSGFGKTTSLGHIPKGSMPNNPDLEIIGLNPAETAIINVKGKPLPFPGWKKLYGKKVSEGGNYAATTDPTAIKAVLNHINDNRLDIKNVILDDMQYIMAEEFMEKALVKGYEKFSALAKNIYDVLNTGINMREDINFIILTHSEETKVGSNEGYKIKTIGKLIDEKVTLEGLFTIVLYGKSSYVDKEVENVGKIKVISKQFVTNFDGEYPAKSPIGMFDQLYIPNDLGLVIQKMTAYNNGD